MSISILISTRLFLSELSTDWIIHIDFIVEFGSISWSSWIDHVNNCIYEVNDIDNNSYQFSSFNYFLMKSDICYWTWKIDKARHWERKTDVQKENKNKNRVNRAEEKRFSLSATRWRDSCPGDRVTTYSP